MTNRINRVNEEILRELTAVFPKLKDPRLSGGLLSVTRVETAGDLKTATVYLSALGDFPELLRGLKSSNGFIRRELARNLNLRQTPELKFVLDGSIARGAHISQLIEQVKSDDDNRNSELPPVEQ